MSYVSYIGALPVPPCAPRFGLEGVDGTFFLEETVPGFRTMSVSGREAWSADITEVSNDRYPGAIYRRMKDDTKDITISFNITVDSRATFASSWNGLRRYLFDEDYRPTSGQIITFNDEPKLYIRGHVTSLTENSVDADNNGVYSMSGEYVFHQSDPYKYAIKDTEVSLSNGMFTTVNAGMYPSKPMFQITCTSVLAGITLVDSEAHIITFGDMSLPSGDSRSKFQKNDKIVIYTDTCSIYQNGKPVPAYGDIGNQWEEFRIKNGTNRIKCTWTAGSTATAKMIYNEVYR